MRDFINGHRQEVLIELGIDAQDLLLLEYLIKLFESGHAYTRKFDDDFYFYISPAKVIQDIPFVVKGERNMRRILERLEQKGIIKRLTYCNQAYLSINFAYLYFGKNKGGQVVPTVSEIAEECCRSSGSECPTIIKYIKNKIYIYYNINKKMVEREVDDIQEFFKQLKIELFSTMSEASYGVCISKAELNCLSPHLIVLNVKEAMPAVKKYHMQTIENAVNKVLKSFKLIA